MGARPPNNFLGAKNYILRTWWWRLASDSELVCWLWHCAATAVALKRHERVNAVNLVRPPVRSNGRPSVLPVMYLFLFCHSFSELPRPIALKLCHVIGIWLNFIIPLQKIEGVGAPKKFGGQKHAKFWSILDHFSVWSRISRERLKISKIGKQYELWQFVLRLTKKVPWTLVH